MIKPSETLRAAQSISALRMTCPVFESGYAGTRIINDSYERLARRYMAATVSPTSHPGTIALYLKSYDQAHTADPKAVRGTFLISASVTKQLPVSACLNEEAEGEAEIPATPYTDAYGLEVQLSAVRTPYLHDHLRRVEESGYIIRPSAASDCERLAVLLHWLPKPEEL